MFIFWHVYIWLFFYVQFPICPQSFIFKLLDNKSIIVYLKCTPMFKKFLGLICFMCIISMANGQSDLIKIEPISFSKVVITDHFWKPKLQLVATKTLNACVYQTETATPRLRNFQKVARKKGEKHEGIFYDDSDVFKALEAIAYSLKNNSDSALERKADDWIDIIAAAQQPDGYLNTWYTLSDITKRYTDMSMHEDYNAGHMIEAAVAYYYATGKRKFLDVSIRWANHFDALFGPTKRHWVTGHQELELALVKLYKVTNDKKYLNLADWLLSERGHKNAVGYTWTDWKDTAYAQDVVPVKMQSKITGHAVRAMYMYTGAADVAAQTGDTGYLSAMQRVWKDVVYKNMYITGGIGSSGSNEGFGIDYDLPNEQAYCETCASVGMVFWNQRMNALTGDAKYMDVLERSLYNGALDGLSLTGDHFFYGNPLGSNGKNARREWFGTACCPANIARLIASLGDYIYAKDQESIYINLFVGSETKINLKGKDVAVKMETNYPLEGTIQITLNPIAASNFRVLLRKPGWANNTVVPGNLYSFASFSGLQPSILVNGKTIPVTEENGYYIIQRQWKKNDMISYQLPMEIKRVLSSDAIKANHFRMALERGPLVYCVEGADNDGKAYNIILPSDSKIEEQSMTILNEQIIALATTVPTIQIGEDGKSIHTVSKKILAIPYYTWCNRGSNQMQVWLPTSIKDVKLNN